MRYALSYAAQQVSGIWSWERDVEHVEKAFDFAGMGARNGVTAAVMAQAGFSGVPDVLDGEHNALEALSSRPQPDEMVAGLGERFYVSETAIKVFSVGYPDSVASRRLPDAAPRAHAHGRQRRAHRRQASRGRRSHRRQPGHARREPAST